MPITISKNDGATVLTLNNFKITSPELQGEMTAIGDIVGSDNDAILVSLLGILTKFNIEWNIIKEPSTVVSGTGSPVTEAVDQFQYLYSTLTPQGSNQITDGYLVTVDYGGSETFSRNGRITKLLTVIKKDEPLSFHGTIGFDVGSVPGSVTTFGHFDGTGTGAGTGAFDGGSGGVGGFDLL